jgi:hypothetical protein
MIPVKYYLGSLKQFGKIFAEVTQYSPEMLPLKWAIRNDFGSTYSIKGKAFVIEPLPSNRTSEYLNDTRFDSLGECTQFYGIFKNKEKENEK